MTKKSDIIKSLFNQVVDLPMNNMKFEEQDLRGVPQVNLYICEDCGEQVDATYTCEDCGKEICFNCAYTTDSQCKCPDCYERKDLLAEIARIGILNCENKTSKELIDIINNYYKKIAQI